MHRFLALSVADISLIMKGIKLKEKNLHKDFHTAYISMH